MTLSVELRKAPVHVDLMPPDASRGVDVPPAVLRYSTDGWRASKIAFSNAAVVPTPIGDLSMSYNVISLTSTLLALFVSGMFSMLVQQQR
jgi:phosphatidylinositol glycan class T